MEESPYSNAIVHHFCSITIIRWNGSSQSKSKLLLSVPEVYVLFSLVTRQKKVLSGKDILVCKWTPGMSVESIRLQLSYDLFISRLVIKCETACAAMVSLWVDDMIKKAASVLGYWTMRLKQLEDVRGFITGYDVFASLPTGSSKSLCFA